MFITWHVWRTLSHFDRGEVKKRIILAAIFSIMGLIFFCSSIGFLFMLLQSGSHKVEVLIDMTSEARDTVQAKISSLNDRHRSRMAMTFINIIFSLWTYREPVREAVQHGFEWYLEEIHPALVQIVNNW